MSDLTRTLAILSAMITPALLITACASLALSTSNRLGRVIDRIRKVSDHVQELAQASEREFLREERVLAYRQLSYSIRRARLLQRALASLYSSLGVFIATSVLLGVSAAYEARYGFVSIGAAILGAALLLYASVLLIVEVRLAIQAVDEETRLALRIAEYRFRDQGLEERDLPRLRRLSLRRLRSSLEDDQ